MPRPPTPRREQSEATPAPPAPEPGPSAEAAAPRVELPGCSGRLARLSPAGRWTFTVGALGAALALRAALAPLIPLPSAAYLTLAPASVLVALLAGTRPGLFAAAAGALAVEASMFAASAEPSPVVTAAARSAVLLGGVLLMGRFRERLRAVQASLRNANAALRAADRIKSEMLDRLQRVNGELEAARDRARAGEAILREKEERFRVIAETMPQIVCVLRPDGTPEYVNAQWTAFAGLDLPATVRAGWAQVVHPDDFAVVADCRLRALRTGAPQEVELRYRRSDGEYRWFLSRLAPVRAAGGRVVRLVGAAMDITAHKEAERMLVEADRRKTEFLGMLSHELRNPLAPIRNSIFLLQRAHPASDQARRARAVIERQSEHLTRLVDDLLDVTRIVRGRIELRRSIVDVREVVQRTAEDLRSVVEGGGLHLSVELPEEAAPVLGDSTRLAQVVGNLLQNAAKFTPAGGHVAVALCRQPDAAEIRVRDTGVGIDAHLLEQMFEPFVQGGRSLARTEGGLGLGLALVKRVAELHGGTVHAVSAGPGSGAEFVLRLPLAAPPAADADARAPATRAWPAGGAGRAAR